MSVERPDYVNLEYEVIVWCDYMEQVNKVVEQIVFFQGRSFGERYKFVIKGDSQNFFFCIIGNNYLKSSPNSKSKVSFEICWFRGFQNSPYF